MSMDMPDFATLEELSESLQERPEDNEPASIPIEDVALEPEDVVVPTFTESSYNYTPPPEDHKAWAEVPIGEPTQLPESEAPKRRRGRQPGSKNRPKSDVQLNNPDMPLTSALRRKTDQELSRRAQGILIGGSKIPSVLNPHVEMTEAEAQSIADPLVSYAKAHVESEKIEQFVEQWDLIAVGIASAAYGMRVVKETRDDPNIGVRRVPGTPRPRVVKTLPVDTEPIRSETFEQGTGDQWASEDANTGVSAPESAPWDI
jgi:hypothetical protein